MTGHIDLGKGRSVRVYELSDAIEAKVWLQVVDDNGVAYAHMTLDQARDLVAQLVFLIGLHLTADPTQEMTNE